MNLRHLKNIGIGLSVWLLVTGCNTDEAKQPTQPNIIMFLVDDMGWQDSSVPFWKKKTQFNELYQTPAMERLADEGMKFNQAYACAVCSPTRVSLLTGMNASRHRVTNWTLIKDRPSEGKPKDLDLPEWNCNGMSPVDTVGRAVYATSLSQLLQNSGYFTIHCGKAHLGAKGTPGENPLNLGFNINIGGHAAGAPGSYQGTYNYGNDKEGNPRNIWSVPGLKKYHGKDINLTEALTLEAINAIDSAQNVNKPFYLYMSHYAVHTPIQPDRNFVQKYYEMGLDSTEAKYASMIESMDKSLGDLMNYIDKKGIADNTIILFMSDNGGLSAVARGGEPHTHNKPLSSGKGSAHEGGIREPMLVKWPGVTRAASVCNQYVIIEDFFPTILEMAGIKEPVTVQTIDGISFVPQLQEPTKLETERALFWHYPNHWGPTGPGIGASSTVRKGDWKLIYYHKDRSFELFNLAQDIGETNNLFKENSEKAKELAKTLTDYLIEGKAQMPTDKATGKTVEWPIDAI